MNRMRAKWLALGAALMMAAGLAGCASSDNVDVHGHVSVGVGYGGYYGSPWYYGGGYYPPPPVVLPPSYLPGHGGNHPGNRPGNRPSGPSAKPLPSIPSSPRPMGGGMRRR